MHYIHYISRIYTTYTLYYMYTDKVDQRSNWWIHCITGNYLSRWYTYTPIDYIHIHYIPFAYILCTICQHILYSVQCIYALVTVRTYITLILTIYTYTLPILVPLYCTIGTSTPSRTSRPTRRPWRPCSSPPRARWKRWPLHFLQVCILYTVYTALGVGGGVYDTVYVVY